ncbi:ATPase, AAA family protein [Plesiocystis pacifica SIR-1]|uniref:ATPase, AAA family protein n=1 Tax=Plesiocystis pacifica SIR-1 TaxID=391625 RepID=A6G2L9_9BACT|nr:MoxR family ATPase [Plesiocystis pacifica]EDM79956.1 ATPase, AAA family protein [Plesiocystis pacifica SIR-1]
MALRLLNSDDNVDVSIAKPTPASPTLDPARLDRDLSAIRSVVRGQIHGKDEIIDLALICLVARGHLLIEDIPGVGKSTLARALAAAIGGTFSRIQFTSDLLPADLLGVNVWRATQEQFEFRQGPIFANLVLADEVNRAPPRTQSALLEAMAEGQVSVDGTSHQLPAPFVVIATQNPEEHHGTYPLPESQRDRFLLRLSMGYASADIEAALLVSGGVGPSPLTEAKSNAEGLGAPTALLDLQTAAAGIHLHRDLAGYAQRVVQTTRDSPEIRLGVSTRGALAWVAAARSRALIEGRPAVLIDDLQELAVPALAHRIVPAQAGSGDQVALAQELVRELIASVPVPV